MYTIIHNTRPHPVITVTIKDCEVQTFRSGGKGGQNQNKVESGVRIVHRPSGAIGESREERSQLQNKKNAFRRMGESKVFQRWIRQLTLDTVEGRKSFEHRVDGMLHEKNLKIEARQANGHWTTIA